MVDLVTGAAPGAGLSQARLDKIRQASQSVEANFLAEMLKSVKFGEMSGTMGGGIGEEQFSSFLRQAEAEKIASSGGIGLSEKIFDAMVRRERDGK